MVEAAAEHGLAALAGSSPDVGVGGYSLGGGISWLGRRHVFAVGITPTPESVEVVEADIRRVQEALAPWDAGRTYLNFSERATSGQRLFGTETYHRLREVKAQYDPEDVFRSNHPIPPARPARRVGAGRPAQRLALSG